MKSHGKHRAHYPALFAAPDTAHATTVRLRSPRAVRRWLADVSSSESSARGEAVVGGSAELAPPPSGRRAGDGDGDGDGGSGIGVAT